MEEKSKKSQRARSEPSLSPVSLSAAIVGRQRELRPVMNHSEVAKGRHAQVVLLSGEPGIGKTRLVDEVALRTAQGGAVVVRGSASEAEDMPPFLLFLEALGRYIRLTPQERLCTQLVAVPQALASLLPELAAYLHDLHAPLPLLPEQAGFRLYEAIGIFLETLSAPHALVLNLDDLCWADTASLDLLCYPTHCRSNAHLLTLGTSRESQQVLEVHYGQEDAMSMYQLADLAFSFPNANCVLVPPSCFWTASTRA